MRLTACSRPWWYVVVCVLCMFFGIGVCVCMSAGMNPSRERQGFNRVWIYIHGYIYNICVCVFVQGLGTDEETLLEILCTRSGKQLQEISTAYTYCKSLNPPSLFQKKKKNMTVVDIKSIFFCILIFIVLFVPCFSV